MPHTVQYNDAIQEQDYCPMCGGRIDRHGDALEEAQGNHDLHDVITGMMRLMLHNRKMMIAVACKLEHPEYSTRRIAEVTGFSSSMVNYYFRDASQILPQLRTILGKDTPVSMAQQARRAGECAHRAHVCATDLKRAIDDYATHLNIINNERRKENDQDRE